jgi:hypothetical protein
VLAGFLNKIDQPMQALDILNKLGDMLVECSNEQSMDCAEAQELIAKIYLHLGKLDLPFEYKQKALALSVRL